MPEGESKEPMSDDEVFEKTDPTADFPVLDLGTEIDRAGKVEDLVLALNHNELLDAGRVVSKFVNRMRKLAAQSRLDRLGADVEVYEIAINKLKDSKFLKAKGFQLKTEDLTKNLANKLKELIEEELKDKIKPKSA
ncbi:MAG: hypothetical protein EXS48_02570 [Candidatus Staskawiczbacteria bacterium]|nr:hypothetical protein [Candidatus Staskawiczbacteria bacterium]